MSSKPPAESGIPANGAQDAERLQAAIEAARRADGAAADNLEELPAELEGPLAAARRLVELGRSGETSDRPRPSFVLGLEEQLRTDLRLGPGGSALGSRGLRRLRWLPAIVLALLFGASLLISASRDALPGQLLYPVKRGLETAQHWLERDPARRAEVCLDMGWNRLSEIEQILNNQAGRSDATLNALLADLRIDYSDALSLSLRSGDARASLRARMEVEAIGVRLGALAEIAPDERAEQLREAQAEVEEATLEHDAREELALLGSPPSEDPAAPAPPAEPSVLPEPSLAPPGATDTAAPSDTPPAKPTNPPPASVTPSSTPSPTAESFQSPTPPGPKPTRARVDTPRPPTSTPEPPPTEDSRVDPTKTQPPPEPTNTRETWPTDPPTELPPDDEISTPPPPVQPTQPGNQG